MRRYEVRRSKRGHRDPEGGPTYSVHQQGTYAPGDGVHRWMGSIAQDEMGNAALGYSVVNGVDVFPGIRYTRAWPAIRSANAGALRAVEPPERRRPSAAARARRPRADRWRS